MLREEALWIADRLTQFSNQELGVLMHVGACSQSNGLPKPHQLELVFNALSSRQVKVVHLNHEAGAIDLTGDLNDPYFVEELKSCRFRSLLCSHLLEHVPDTRQFCRSLEHTVEEGGLLFITVPHTYPYHGTPVDTLFRPKPEEVLKLFPGCRLLESHIVMEKETHAGTLLRNPARFVRQLGQVFLRRPAALQQALQYLPQAFRRYKTTCLVLQKTSATAR